MSSQPDLVLDPGFVHDRSLRVELNPTWVLPSRRIFYLVLDPGFAQDKSLRVELNPTWTTLQDLHIGCNLNRSEIAANA
jgi:hypothetical protein